MSILTSCPGPLAVTVKVCGVKVKPGTVGAVTVTGPLNPEAIAPIVKSVNAPEIPFSCCGVAVSAKSSTCSVNDPECVPLTAGDVPVNANGRKPEEAFGATPIVTVCDAPGVRLKDAGVNVTSDAVGEVMET